MCLPKPRFKLFLCLIPKQDEFVVNVSSDPKVVFLGFTVGGIRMVMAEDHIVDNTVECHMQGITRQIVASIHGSISNHINCMRSCRLYITSTRSEEKP